MEIEDIVKNNIEVMKHTKKCDHNLGDIKIIYKRCKDCGKFVVCPDEELINKRGVTGKANY